MQTWKDNNVPDKWKDSPESIRKHMPDWQYILMTDEDNRNFIEEHFPDFLPRYDSFRYNIQRVDAIRACWLYINGGVYIDLDIVVNRPLDSLFESNCDAYFVSSANVSSYITNAFMASKPRCNIWLEYIERMKQEESPLIRLSGKNFIVMTTTGPMCLTETLKSTETIYAKLPSKLLTPYSVCDIQKIDLNNIPEDLYLYPLPGGSWNDWTSKSVNAIMCNWRTIVVIFLVIVIVFLYIVIIRNTK